MSAKSIYWRLQNKEALPDDDAWLSPQEKSVLAEMQFSKRQEDWKLGRWTAKLLIHSYVKNFDNGNYHFANLEVLPDEDGSPRVLIQKKPSPVKISISHRAGAGFCALSPTADSIGCDLEIIEERSDAFVSDYFTFEEKLKVIVAAEEDKPLLANLIWSAKESVLKSLRQGLKSDTRNVLIDLSHLVVKQGWNEIRARSLESNHQFWGWWQHKEKYVFTIFSSEITEEPVGI